MSLYRLEIERGDTLWVTAHDEQGAIEIAAAHIVGETYLEEDAVVKLMHDADGTLVLRAAAGHWSTSARR